MMTHHPMTHMMTHRPKVSHCVGVMGLGVCVMSIISPWDLIYRLECLGGPNLTQIQGTIRGR
jgi:hypothetical protein